MSITVIEDYLWTWLVTMKTLFGLKGSYYACNAVVVMLLLLCCFKQAVRTAQWFPRRILRSLVPTKLWATFGGNQKKCVFVSNAGDELLQVCNLIGLK